METFNIITIILISGNVFLGLFKQNVHSSIGWGLALYLYVVAM